LPTLNHNNQGTLKAQQLKGIQHHDNRGEHKTMMSKRNTKNIIIRSNTTT
jgi:hypothetical protein